MSAFDQFTQSTALVASVGSSTIFSSVAASDVALQLNIEFLDPSGEVVTLSDYWLVSSLIEL